MVIRDPICPDDANILVGELAPPNVKSGGTVPPMIICAAALSGNLVSNKESHCNSPERESDGWVCIPGEVTTEIKWKSLGTNKSNPTPTGDFVPRTLHLEHKV